MTKFTSKTTKENYIPLPKGLVADIKALPLTKTQQSHCRKFVGILLRDSFRKYLDITSPVDKPQTFLISSFDRNYNSWLKPLINKGIVKRSDWYSYNSENNQCYSYSVNPSYFLSSGSTLFTYCIHNTGEALETVGYKEIVRYLRKDTAKMTNLFTQDIETLKIDYTRLRGIVEKRVTELAITDYKVDEQIGDSTVKLQNGQGQMYYMPLATAIETARSKGMSVIQDKGKFVIDTPESFIAQKKVAIMFAYTDSIVKLENGAYRAQRNDTNNRLDTNFTNMCADLVDDICDQNDLVQIDLNNSQFAILSHILKGKLDSDDYSRFKGLSISGQLYDYIKEELDLASRKAAKLVMFELLFSSRKNSTAGKAKLKTIFPTVVKWIDDYKKVNGDEAFAVMLQSEESKIFIDGIYMAMKKKKMFCLTKHDSIIVRSAYMDEALAIINEHFNRIDFENKLDITMPTVIEEEIVSEIAPIELTIPQIISTIRNRDNSGRVAMAEYVLKNYKDWDEYKIRGYYAELVKPPMIF